MSKDLNWLKISEQASQEVSREVSRQQAALERRAETRNLLLRGNLSSSYAYSRDLLTKPGNYDTWYSWYLDQLDHVKDEAFADIKAEGLASCALYYLSACNYNKALTLIVAAEKLLQPSDNEEAKLSVAQAAAKVRTACEHQLQVEL